MLGWYATFTDLRNAGVALQDWLDFHRGRREHLTAAERLQEENIT